MAKQVFDLHGSAGISSGQSTEHLRNYKVTDPDMKKYGYYDPTRSNLNFEVGRGGIIMPVNKHFSINKRFADNLRSRGIKDPNEEKKKKGKDPNRRTVVNIILGGSRDQMHKLAFGEQKVDLLKDADNRGLERKEDIEKWAVDMYHFIARRFGEENIVAFVVHLDEKNPHIHCTLVPVVDGKISYKKLLSGKNKNDGSKIFKDLHDRAAVINAKWKLERGDDINTTGARHRTSEEYWLELREKCNALEKEQGSKLATIDVLNKELRKAEITQRSLTTMINNMTAERDALQQQIEELEERNNQMDGESFSLETTIQQMAQQISELDRKIEQKKASLDEYVSRRAELIDEIVKLKQEQLELIRKNVATKDDLERNMLARDVQVTNALGLTGFSSFSSTFQVVCEELCEWGKSLPIRQYNQFDELFAKVFQPLLDSAEKCNEIIAVAAALYYENYNAADEVARSCGGCGGGGGGQGGWGRKKDEDDEAFRNRCFLMGAMMMRPAGRRLKR